MSARQIAYRIKSEGKAEVVADAREVGEAFRASYGEAATAAKALEAAEAAAFARKRDNVSRAGVQGYGGATPTDRDFRGADAAAFAEEAEARNRAIREVLGVDRQMSASARESAAVFMAEAEAAEHLEARARALKIALDPLSAAQDRLNDELREYQMLASAGKISTAELAQAQALARGRFDDTSAAIARQEKGLSRMVLQGRLNLARQGADVFTTAAMGMNPGMIAIQQGPQILEAMSQAGIKATGSMLLMGGAITAAAAGVAVLGAAWHSGEAASLRLDRAVTGLGRTSGLTADQLEQLTLKSAEQGRVAVGSAHQQAVAYVSTGRIGREQIAGLIAIGRDYASVMGMDAEEATQSLAKAMLSPDKAARDLTRTMGLLDQETLAQIDSMVKQGDLMGAQQLLIDGLNAKLKGHADQLGEVETAWEGIARWASKAWHEVGTYLQVTDTERFNKLVGARAEMERRGGPNSPSERTVYDEWGRQAVEIQNRQRQLKEQMEGSAENQAAQLAWDRAREAAKNRRRGDRLAEREERERLARERRDEDRQAAIDLEVARAANDFEGIQRLEDEAAVRQRIRQLVDDETDAETARTKALEEQARLVEAREVAQEREVARARTTSEIEIMRAGGEERLARSAERRVELAARIEFYHQRSKDLVTAEAMATAELADLDAARAVSYERRLAAQQRAWDLELARARGDSNAVRQGERGEWIERRAREIESDPDRPLNFGEGDAQAIREWGEMWSAEAEGRRRAWAKGFAADVRREGWGNAVANQLERAADRFLDKLIDGLLDIDWASFLNGGSGGGFNLGSLISGGLDFLSGVPAAPTGRGGDLDGLFAPTAPPSSKADAQAMQMSIAAGAGGKGSAGPAGPWSFTFAPVLHAEGAGPREVEALSAKLDQMAAQLRAEIPQIVNDGVSRRTIRGLA